MNPLPKEQITQFQQAIFAHYDKHSRHALPWRQAEPDGTFDPYKILVSEVMLQQTQVPRVMPKFEAFLRQFPALRDLAGATLAEVLQAWQGLGYNRRAKYLWLAAQAVMRDFAGQLPAESKSLQQLPGVGVNTAGAILVYAYNQPMIFVETNIRTVYIHHFLRDQTGIADARVCDLLMQTLDYHNPRDFYWALMDYGSYLKRTMGNLSRASKGYTKQSPFHGSRRQIRGQVIRLLAERSHSHAELAALIQDPRLTDVLQDLEAEEMIVCAQKHYKLLAD